MRTLSSNCTQRQNRLRSWVCVCVRQKECVCVCELYRSRHHQVGLRVEIAAENIVTVAFKSLQTLSLSRDKDRHRCPQRQCLWDDIITLDCNGLMWSVCVCVSYRIIIPDLERFVIRGGDQQVGVWRPWDVRDPLHIHTQVDDRCRHRPSKDPDQDRDTHQFVSHDRFLKLSIIRSPDLYQLISSCTDMLSWLLYHHHHHHHSTTNS